MPRNRFYLVIFLVVLTFVPPLVAHYKIGVGRADCTGPAASIVFMGYAKSSQKGCGLHLRQYSRAFIFDDGVRRAAFVTVDVGMISHGVRKAVITRLSEIYNSTYKESNLILSGTHTHSAPGGYLMNFMYDLPGLGFAKETFDSLVDGISKSVVRAHESMVDGRIFLISGKLLGANINRSPMSYLLNPKEERDKYKYNVDKEMVQVQFRTLEDTLLGAVNWFPVHPTSMNHSNCLLTSDNVGYASVLLEKSQNKDSHVGQGRFVGAFASTNLGDVSPNLKGPRCINTGETCDMLSSTCDGEAALCVAAGPGTDMFESTKIIAEKLFDKAKILLGLKAEEVKGSVRHIHRFVDMPSEKATIELPNGTTQEVHGCLPAMGYSFAAGTTDGVGEFGFSQGTRSANSYWNTLRDLLFQPTEQDVICHHPKPILINSGRISTPYEWQPRIVSTQLVQLGNLFLIAVPGEFTTMSGRRLREAVIDTVTKNGGPPDAKAVITGLSNVYTSYITTPEEYQMQRYEGASTIFGPHTLDLYLNIYREMAEALIKDEKLLPGPTPPDLSSKVMSLIPSVMFDTSGFLHQFGDCLLQPQPLVKKGSTVKVKFVSGNPRNNLMHEKTFLTVEKLEGDKWIVIATDADWETKFIWKKDSDVIGGSRATVEWTVPLDATPGTYKIRHFGYYKSLLGGTYPYHGSCRSFTVE